MSAELSGRVTTLENQVTYITQDLLQKVDLVTSSQQSSIWNQNYTQVYDLVTEMQVMLRNLQSMYANLNYTVSRNYNLFTGHTGIPASSGHNGV